MERERKREREEESLYVSICSSNVDCGVSFFFLFLSVYQNVQIPS